MVRQNRNRTRENVKLRKFTVEYRLNAESEYVTVCKECFLNSLGETDGFIKNVVTKYWTNMNVLTSSEKMGKNIPASYDMKIKEIEDHMESFQHTRATILDLPHLRNIYLQV